MLSQRFIFISRRLGASLSAGLVLVVFACLVLPAGASAFQKAIWGSPTYNGVNQFPMYHQLGVTIDEVDLPWAEVAPTRPKDPANPNDPAYHWPAEIAQSRTATFASTVSCGGARNGSDLPPPYYARGRRASRFVPEFVSAAA